MATLSEELVNMIIDDLRESMVEDVSAYDLLTRKAPIFDDHYFVEKIMEEIDYSLSNSLQDAWRELFDEVSETVENKLADLYDFEGMAERFCFDPESIRDEIESIFDSQVCVNDSYVNLDSREILSIFADRWLLRDAQAEFQRMYF